MRKIDITTTQNVTIEYELATVMERTMAFFLDFAVSLVGTLLIYWFASILGSGSFRVAYIYFLLAGSFLYHVLIETLNHGQSVGKLALKIRVVKITGERPDFFDYLMRTAFRFIDITMTMGALALISISSSEKGQRLGDFFADTTVIKLNNISRFSLSRLLAMDQLKDVEPTYPGVIKFTEEEMLLIKESLDRYSQYPNDSHYQAIRLLVRKIEEQLNIKAPSNAINFLNTLIKDYVNLTR